MSEKKDFIQDYGFDGAKEGMTWRTSGSRDELVMTIRGTRGQWGAWLNEDRAKKFIKAQTIIEELEERLDYYLDYSAKAQEV